MVFCLLERVLEVKVGDVTKVSGVLVVFTKGFPYGASEPFLETECPLYGDYFKSALIVTPFSGNERPSRVIPEGITVLPVKTSGSAAVIKVAIAAITSFDFWREFRSLFFEKRMSFKNLQILVSTVGKGSLLAASAKCWCEERQILKPGAVYSYWLNTPAYAAALFAAKFNTQPLCISRAHGFDLYEERAKNQYPCLQKEIVSRLDAVYSISEDGKRDLSKRYSRYSEKIRVSRLGARDQGELGRYGSRCPLRIVSCSRLVPIKRIHLVVEALREITDIQIEWTHIGGGPGFDELAEVVKSLPLNVKVRLMGTVPNVQIYDLYAENEYHVFVNVSESEGIPVSIMEAMSYGLPVIATDVGGVAELVDDGVNGWLLPADFPTEDLVASFRKVHEIDEGCYRSMREASKVKFSDEYNGIKNYRSFLNDLTRGKQ